MNGYYVVDAIVGSYRDLRVWRFGMDLVVECYELTKTFTSRLSFVGREAGQRLLLLTADLGRMLAGLQSKLRCVEG